MGVFFLMFLICFPIGDKPKMTHPGSEGLQSGLQEAFGFGGVDAHQSVPWLSTLCVFRGDIHSAAILRRGHISL